MVGPCSHYGGHGPIIAYLKINVDRWADGLQPPNDFYRAAARANLYNPAFRSQIHAMNPARHRFVWLYMSK